MWTSYAAVPGSAADDVPLTPPEEETKMRGSRAVYAAVAVTATVLAAAGCGNSSSSNNSSSSGDLSGKTVQLITGVKDDPFYITMTCGAQEEAKKLGVQFKSNGSAQWDVSQQRPIID